MICLHGAVSDEVKGLRLGQKKLPEIQMVQKYFGHSWSSDEIMERNDVRMHSVEEVVLQGGDIGPVALEHLVVVVPYHMHPIDEDAAGIPVRSQAQNGSFIKSTNMKTTEKHESSSSKDAHLH